MSTDTPATAPLLDLDHVHRKRGGRAAVSDLSLSVQRGDVLGLLGVNGAGKSTTLAMMAGALAPHAGQVRIQGLDLAEHPATLRKALGWLPEQAPLYDELTVLEQLTGLGRLHGLSRRQTAESSAILLNKLQLESMARRLTGQLSQGQRQRVGLACALLHDPPLLVLDEPANGLDPVQIENWQALVHDLSTEHAVVISTHVLDDVTSTCNRIAILHEGRLRHSGPMHADTGQLRQRFIDIAGQRQQAAA